ncbi:hypothetical protein [Lactiplantibacillus paraxiangfangensis]|uniref:hypothetical protein n=1 Tax=Lactiplantibacillus paraxiangfangensis TaxID=3076224 RepID=UPI0030C6B5F1
MKKRYWLGGGLLVLLLLAGTLLVVNRQTSQPASKPATAPVAKKKPQPSVPPLTHRAWKKQPELKYAGIIYYAVKHLKIQRWQEVSDFKKGWQVEIYPGHAKTKYLVWPDQNIREEAKQLEPNWFTLNADHTVTYDSFGVHTFEADQTATVSEAHILKQLRADHAAKKVYGMLDQLQVVKHH